MKSTLKQPEAAYPYLAIWTMGEPLPKEIKMEEIVVVSIVPIKDQYSQPYVQPLHGGKEGFFTKKESEYTPLPKGFILTLEN